MPKLKTHKGTSKRLKRTATDKLLRGRANRTHFLEKKSSSRKRGLATKAKITGSIRRNLKRVLGAK